MGPQNPRAGQASMLSGLGSPLQLGAWTRTTVHPARPNLVILEVPTEGSWGVY